MEARGPLQVFKKPDKNFKTLKVGDTLCNIFPKHNQYNEVDTIKGKSVVMECKPGEKGYNDLVIVKIDETAPQPAQTQRTTAEWDMKDIRDKYIPFWQGTIQRGELLHGGDMIAACEQAKIAWMFWVNMCNEMGLFSDASRGLQSNSQPETSNPQITWDSLKELANSKGVKTQAQMNELLGTKDYKKEATPEYAQQELLKLP